MTSFTHTLRSLLAALLLATAVNSAPAQAEPGPISTWLMKEPLTLFDWGMYRAGKRMSIVANRLEEIYPEGWFFPKEIYSWDRDEIHFSWHIYFDPSDYLPTDDPGDWPATHDTCNYFRKLILHSVLWVPVQPDDIEGLSSNNPGLRTSTDILDPRKQAGVVLDLWFAHMGERGRSLGIPYFERTSRPADLGNTLAYKVWLSVILQDKSRDKIECKARITEWDAPSKPLS